MFSCFWLHYFRLEKGTLPWPQQGDEKNPLDITWQDLRQLLEGTPLRPIERRLVSPLKYVL
ncbi:MAG TPA: transposase [Natronincola sp.]|nr:transposase [Natronincola sp.]